jgi:triosephosphate isomerase
VNAALEHGLRPLICVGESDVQRNYSVAEEVVTYQVKIALHDVSPNRIPDVLIAYEPGWAIGEKGTEASQIYVNAMHRRIREVIGFWHGQSTAEQVHILYGGSVTSTNAAAFANQPEVDGLFVGRAAYEVGSFVDIVRRFCAARVGDAISPEVGNS